MTDTYAGGDLLAEVVRSGFVEGFHRGSVLVLDDAGRVVATAGDVTGPILPRSATKPMQAVGALRAGLRLPDAAELALACGSHRGQPPHVERVRAMLAAGGLGPSALRCPPDYPLDPDARDALVRAGTAPDPVFMNCSGKHAAMLRCCLVNGWSLDDYLDPGHPLQRVLRQAVTDLAGEEVAATAVDGCGAPAFAISLRGLATAFLRLVHAEPGDPPRSVADAMRAHPELVSGLDPAAHDSRLMSAVPGLVSKGGAEGVLAVAVPGAGAVALKIDDGALRARLPVLHSALRRLGVTAPIVTELARQALHGGGAVVGSVRAVW
jgi:L-asparaginase II